MGRRLPAISAEAVRGVRPDRTAGRLRRTRPTAGYNGIPSIAVTAARARFKLHSWPVSAARRGGLFSAQGS